MKQIIGILAIIVLSTACSGFKKKSKADEATVTVEQAEGLVSYAYKVDGLQDSVISDAIWRLIFQLEGIDKLVLSKDDSVALFTVDPSKVSDSLLKAEIENRGGKILN